MVRYVILLFPKFDSFTYFVMVAEVQSLFENVYQTQTTLEWYFIHSLKVEILSL